MLVACSSNRCLKLPARVALAVCSPAGVAVGRARVLGVLAERVAVPCVGSCVHGWSLVASPRLLAGRLHSGVSVTVLAGLLHDCAVVARVVETGSCPYR